MSMCACSCDDYDPPETVHISSPVARVAHTCCECGCRIPPGSRYERVVGVWRGHPDTHKTCLACVRIRTDYCPCGYIYGELRRTLDDCLGIDYLEAEVDEDEEAEG